MTVTDSRCHRSLRRARMADLAATVTAAAPRRPNSVAAGPDPELQALQFGLPPSSTQPLEFLEFLPP